MSVYVCKKCKEIMTNTKGHKCAHQAVTDLVPATLRSHRPPGGRRSSIESQVRGSIELAYRRGYDKGWEDAKAKRKYHADY